jgi:hypothetical protein
MYVDIT